MAVAAAGDPVGAGRTGAVSGAAAGRAHAVSLCPLCGRLGGGRSPQPPGAVVPAEGGLVPPGAHPSSFAASAVPHRGGACPAGLRRGQRAGLLGPELERAVGAGPGSPGPAGGALCPDVDPGAPPAHPAGPVLRGRDDGVAGGDRLSFDPGTGRLYHQQGHGTAILCGGPGDFYHGHLFPYS